RPLTTSYPCYIRGVTGHRQEGCIKNAAPETDAAYPGPGFGLPRADTGNRLLDWISDTGLLLIAFQRRFDPFFRPAFDRLFRDRLSSRFTALINRKRKRDGLGLAEERLQPDEDAHLDDIIATFTAQLRRLWTPGHFERGLLVRGR